ncbi:MAG: aminoacyl-tRNA hydrolase [Oscillospiraceae bacterium]|nr:aminoacyl-tRNA hydrolase [Oscillospiraceae bacterium]
MFWKKKSTPVSWIAIFLGNPGKQYDQTRHNAGFLAGDVVAERMGVKINRIKFSSLTAVATIDGQSVLLLKPQTYMNLSGGALWQAMAFYKVPLENVIVVFDDVALPPGKLRVRRKGSSGGHNGLKDIIRKCGGDTFPRIKIGVGSPPHDDYEMADWVLSKLSGEDGTLVFEAAAEAANALKTIVTQGVDAAMAKYN